MDELLKGQAEKAEEITRLISNYRKDGAERKTKKYLETRIAAMKKAYNEYVDRDNIIRNFQPQLKATHQYFDERKKVLEIYTKGIDDMRRCLNEPYLPSTPTLTTDETSSTSKFVFPSSEKDNNNCDDDGGTDNKTNDESQSRHSQLPKFNPLLKQQDIKIRGLYREIRSTEEILATNNKSRSVLNLKMKNMERMMMQIMDIHEKICIETSEQQEANLKYFVDRHYENLNDEYDNIVIAITTLLEEEQSKAKPLEIRLPPVEIPNFHGDYMKWTGFADTFRRLVHENNQLSDTHKMNYLKSHVQGAAGKLLSHLQPTGENYSAA